MICTWYGTPALRRILLAEQVQKWFAHGGAEFKHLKNLDLWIHGGREWQARTLLHDAFPAVLDMRSSHEVLADRKARFGNRRADAAAQTAVQREQASAENQDDWMRLRFKGGAA